MNILVTGGAGFIGSHTVVELLNAGHRAVILDNLCNASPKVVRRIEAITGQAPVFIEGDIRDRTLLQKIFAEHKIDSVIHFAALKAVGESVAQPLRYYDNNVAGSLVLLQEMDKAGVKSIIFSSSATVYGDKNPMPLTESAPVGTATNPYGSSKIMMERMMMDMQHADPEWSVTLLRYFNPIGAHESGKIGEQPNGIPNNLLPYVCQVASGKLTELSVFGSDYDTPDGTCIRDYIHVLDLAEAHIAALDVLAEGRQPDHHTYNVGTGLGTSVREIIDGLRRVIGWDFPVEELDRRAGDPPKLIGDPLSIGVDLGGKANNGLDEILTSAWEGWQAGPRPITVPGA